MASAAMERLRDSLTDVPIVSMDEYQYFIHPLTDGVPRIDPALLRDVTNEIIRRVAFDDIDVILVPEAMGIHLGTALSLQVDVPLAIARKRSYGLDGEVSVAQVTGYDENDLYINGIDAEDRVLVVDDVISTGGTMSALIDAVTKIGAQLEQIIVVFEKDGGKPAAIPESAPVDSLLGVSIVDDRVEITTGS